MVPTYMSRVVRTLACPAMQDTSVASSFQVNRAVTQNTCRRLCQVHCAVAAGVAPSGRQVGVCQDAAVEVGGPPVLAARAREDQPGRVGAGVHLGACGLDPGLDLLRQRVPLRGADGVDGLAALAALGQPGEQRAATSMTLRSTSMTRLEGVI